jgi:hypothetical protein
MQCPGIVIRVRPSGYVGSIQDAMKLWEEDAFCRLGLETGRADKFLCAAMRQSLFAVDYRQAPRPRSNGQCRQGGRGRQPYIYPPWSEVGEYQGVLGRGQRRESQPFHAA